MLCPLCVRACRESVWEGKMGESKNHMHRHMAEWQQWGCGCSSLPWRMMEKIQKTWLSHPTHQPEESKGGARSSCLAGGREGSHRNTLAVVAWPDEIEGLQRLGRWETGFAVVPKIDKWAVQALLCLVGCSSWTLLFPVRKGLPWSGSGGREMCHGPTSPCRACLLSITLGVQPLCSCGAWSIYLFQDLALRSTDGIGCGSTSISQMSSATWEGRRPKFMEPFISFGKPVNGN